MTVIKEWDGTQWVPIVVGKQGPNGPTGPTGPTGAASTVTGPTGPTGALQPGDDDQYILSLQIFS